MFRPQMRNCASRNDGEKTAAKSTKLPVGQLVFGFTESMSREIMLKIENNSLFQKQEQGYIDCIPSRPEGRSRSPRTRDGERWTWKRLGDGRGSVRQRRVVLTSHGWRRRWQQYMAHRGERVISRKAIAQGMSDVLRCPCMLMRTLFRVDRA